MPLDSYGSLISATLQWLARPDDPLIAPAVPDMIRLFEAEATRRLKIGSAEAQTTLNVSGGEVFLPADFAAMRLVSVGGHPLTYLTPEALPAAGAGQPGYYTLVGATWLLLQPAPASPYTVEILYHRRIPPLSAAAPSNALLQDHPDAYLFGTLAEAEPYIGHDERFQLWMQRRDAALLSIERADRKARWAGPLQIRPDIVLAGGRRGPFAGVIAPEPPVEPAGWVVRVISPVEAEVVILNPTDRLIYVLQGTLGSLTFRLPPGSAMTDGEDIEICFAASVISLTVTDSTGASFTGSPTNAYGPGATIVVRWVNSIGWVYWK